MAYTFPFPLYSLGKTQFIDFKGKNPPLIKKTFLQKFWRLLLKVHG
jgi:hypothetical protein